MPDLAFTQLMFLFVITLAAGIVQSATGFGFAVIAVPLFLLTLDSTTVIQINIVLNLVNALLIAPRIWRLAPTGLLRDLCVGALIGLPIGIVVFNMANVDHLKVAVAVLIIGFCVHLMMSSTRRATSRVPGKTGSITTGGFSGALTSALAMPGPPVLIYLAHFDVDKDAFRATNLSLYVVAYGCALLLQATLGDMSLETWTISAILVPVVILGAATGHALAPWLSERVFRASVLVTLLATGVYMIYATLDSMVSATGASP